VSDLTSISSAASPFKFPILWDSLSLGGGAFTWRGKLEIRGAKRWYKWQQKNAPGKKGADQTFRARWPQPFQIRLFVWTHDDWGPLLELLDWFNYDATKLGPTGTDVKPIDIYHPQLSIVDISQVVCDWVQAPEVEQERSGWAIATIQLREFAPAVNAPVVSPKSTGKPAATPFLVDSGAGVQAQIQTQSTGILDLSSQLAQPGSLP
jgi:hypothetical protein